MKTLFDSSDIIRLFKETDKRIDKLECFFETCCAKVPINVGSGEGLYKRLHKNKWEFKSLIAGSNITITDNGSDLTINSTGGGSVTCADIDTCLGISLSGSATKYLNEQGDWQTITMPSDYWSLTGNVGTNSAVNFLGTTDGQGLTVKINNTHQAFFGLTGGLIIGQASNGVTGQSLNIGSASNLTGSQSLLMGISNSLQGNTTFGFGSGTIIVADNSFIVDTLNSETFTQSNSFIVSSLYSGFSGSIGSTAVNPTATLHVDGTFRYVDGNEANGYILTSDASGNATWQTSTSAPITPAALTKTDDTNVTLTLGGTPATSLLQATSLTLGWTGTLADGRIASATNWNDAYTNRITSLTTTGTSGAATLIANVLNIPQYSGTTRLDQILAATATNTIANANNAQVWNWDTLTTQTALKIASTSVTTGSLLNLVSTSTASNGEIGLNVNMSGANANASRTSTGIYVSQTKSGTTPNNYGIDVVLSGAGNVTNKIGVRSVISGGTNWGFNNYAGYFSNTTIGSTQVGVYGDATGGNSVSSIGVYGKTTSPYNNASGYGVYGENTNVASNGFSYGVYGSAGNNATLASGSIGYGVYGISGGAGTATRYGGYFTALGYTVGGNGASATVIGLYASASGGATNNYGLLVAAGSVGIGTITPTSSVQINGSFAAGYVAKTANYTLTISDRLVNCTANSFTITLPTAVGITGREYIIKNTGTATTITIATTSAQTIDGLIPSTYNVTTLTPLRVMSDGANWITC